MSYRPMFLCQDEWCGNALVFATHEEAEGYARDLFSRWTVPSKWRVDEVDLPVTHRWWNAETWRVERLPEGST